MGVSGARQSSRTLTSVLPGSGNSPRRLAMPHWVGAAVSLVSPRTEPGTEGTISDRWSQGFPSRLGQRDPVTTVAPSLGQGGGSPAVNPKNIDSVSDFASSRVILRLYWISG